MSSIKNFTFIALTYNHSRFILEHLESIKYIIQTFGRKIDVDIIVADDASKDNTVELSNSWLDKNACLFRKVTVLSDGINRGTCKNLALALNIFATDYCKITGGDDVFSCENLFAEVEKIDGNDILSGFPLNLIGTTLSPTQFDLFNLIATNIIYQHSPYEDRLKKINFFNSPNIVYSVSALKNKEVLSFVERYSVTEDYPMQIKMADLYRPLKFIQIEKVLVYYRRTAGSTYLTKNSVFSADKLAIFDYLVQSEIPFVGRLLLINRAFCFKLKNRYLKMILNINVYLYGFSILLNILNIVKRFRAFNPQLMKHQAHYSLIASKAKSHSV